MGANLITQNILKSLLSYDPETGNFMWLVRRGSVNAGDIAGCVKAQGYFYIRINGKTYGSHRLAWCYMHGELPPNCIDHINGITGDNRISNLRLATNAQNLMNQGKHSNNSSGFKGVTWHAKAKKWQATCRANGVRKHLGLFGKAEDASQAYQDFAKVNHGAFFNG